MTKVELFEVGPRDGLQNEARQIPTTEKIALIDLLSQSGFQRIEVASFVSPKWVPQMADASEVLGGITRAPGVSYAALTPNMRGFEGAVAAKADEIAVFASASEGFSKANVNASIADSLARFAPILEAAQMPVRGYVSCVVDCPYDGPTPPENVARVAGQLRDMGCYEVSLGDTLGRASPDRVDAMLKTVLNTCDAGQLAGHFHDTSGGALANIDVALSYGVRVFDTSVGGLGGCPYAPGAAGNVATEAVHGHLTALGYDTGLNEKMIAQAAQMAQEMRNV